MEDFIKKKIERLTKMLNKASELYYNTGKSPLTDREFDELLDELSELENKHGYRLNDSPTINVGSTAVDSLKKVSHVFPMLSLDKCHSVSELLEFMKNETSLLMMKMDGLTIRVTYVDGNLVRIETRGDGHIGNDVTHLKNAFVNLPTKLSSKIDLIVDGECVITYDDFEKINATLPEDSKYKNPRNLAAGSLSVLKCDDIVNRPLKFYAWRVIENNCYNYDSMIVDLADLHTHGFSVTPYTTIYNGLSEGDIKDVLDFLREQAKKYNLPIDGCVCVIDSKSKGFERGKTDKFFKHSIAYKFEDDRYPSKVIDVEWTMGKTGQITPTLIFDPVEIDGTTVTRASIHNVSIFKQLRPTKRCTAYIYKANQIIPQCDNCEMDGFEEFQIPKKCPICGSNTEVVKTDKTEFLICCNDDCSGKIIKKFSHFVSKNAFDIDGLSEATLEKIIEQGWIENFCDIFKLEKYYAEMVKLEGFGARKVQKLLKAIEKSRHIELDKFLCSLSIPLIGKTASKLIANSYDYDWQALSADLKANNSQKLKMIDGVGDSMVDNIFDWFNKKYKSEKIYELIELITLIKPVEKKSGDLLRNNVFCITGKLEKFTNRDELQKLIEDFGGKVVSSVNMKTTYLINNDTESESSKNKKAKELRIPIISEKEFIELLERR